MSDFKMSVFDFIEEGKSKNRDAFGFCDDEEPNLLKTSIEIHQKRSITTGDVEDWKCWWDSLKLYEETAKSEGGIDDVWFHIQCFQLEEMRKILEGEKNELEQYEKLYTQEPKEIKAEEIDMIKKQYSFLIKMVHIISEKDKSELLKNLKA